MHVHGNLAAMICRRRVGCSKSPRYGSDHRTKAAASDKKRRGNVRITDQPTNSSADSGAPDRSTNCPAPVSLKAGGVSRPMCSSAPDKRSVHSSGSLAADRYPALCFSVLDSCCCSRHSSAEHELKWMRQAQSIPLTFSAQLPPSVVFLRRFCP